MYLQDWRFSRALQGHGVQAAADCVDCCPHVHGIWEDCGGNIQTHGAGVCRQTCVMWYVDRGGNIQTHGAGVCRQTRVMWYVDCGGNIQTHGAGVCRQTRVMWYVKLRPCDFAWPKGWSCWRWILWLFF